MCEIKGKQNLLRPNTFFFFFKKKPAPICCQDIHDFCATDQCLLEYQNVFCHWGPNLHYSYDNLKQHVFFFACKQMIWIWQSFYTYWWSIANPERSEHLSQDSQKNEDLKSIAVLKSSGKEFTYLFLLLLQLHLGFSCFVFHTSLHNWKTIHFELLIT